jgi:hypothetical protein
LAAILGMYYGQKLEIFKSHEVEKVEVVMERVAKVFKMVAVEGYVSEIYDYKQYKYWDINFLRKKAMVRVKAKVSVGFDFEKAKFDVDEGKKEIIIQNFPEPEILSIDHDLDYYNLDEGFFNSFDEKELTELNAKAKKYAIEMIKNGELFKEAESQKSKIIDLLSALVAPSGWKVTVKNKKRMVKG